MIKHIDEHGRENDIIIEDVYLFNDLGIETLTGMIVVWADEGLKELIFKISGISRVENESPFHYYVFLDPRYDREFVKKEIEAKILCRKEDNENKGRS